MGDSSNEVIPLVDEHDVIIGYKKRKEVTRDDIYRVSACRIVDEAGNILLAQRARTKSHHPGKWGPAVAGTVKEGESYLQNIIKEIEEEVGILVTEHDLQFKEKLFKTRDRKHFTSLYLLVYRGDKSLLRAEPGGVEQLKRYTPSELTNALQQTPNIFLESIFDTFARLST